MESFDQRVPQVGDLTRESLAFQVTEIVQTKGQQSFPGQTAISLFSGGGGLDIGVEKAGYRTLACIEKDPHCCETLKYNQPRYLRHARIINDDVDNIDVRQLMKTLGLRKGSLDLLFGGPPCQTFSQIGKMDGINDARGLLLFSMVRYAEILRPKAVLIENVSALKSAKDASGESGGILRELLRRLESLGYRVEHRVLNSADYGVAQLRKRLFVVATRQNKRFTFPAGKFTEEGANPYVTVGQAIEGIGRPVSKGMTPILANHVDVTPEGDIRRIRHVTEGAYLAKMFDAPPEIRGRLSKKDTTKFLRLSREKPSNTLRCGEIFFHPTYDRYLTPREYMRIHGFPDDYHLMGPIRGRSGSVRFLDQHRQVANSVPPPMGEEVATAILAATQQVSGEI